MFHSDFKTYSILKKQHTRCIILILCQESFKEQREKLVRLSFYTTENVKEKTKSGYILYPLSNSRLKYGMRSCS